VTLEELRAELDAGRLRPAYLLAGAEPCLRDDALAAILDAAFGTGPRDFDLDRLEGEATPPARLLDIVRTLPVLAPRRVTVLREPEARRAGAAELARAIGEAAGELAGDPHGVLVVVAAKVDRRSAWVKAFAEPAALVDCEPPARAADVVAFVRAEARRQGLDLEPGAAELLAERIGPQLLALRQELAKAALYAGAGARIRRTHVAELASDLAGEPVWDLTDAIGEGRAPDALRSLHRLLAGGAPPVVLLGALASHFRRLARVAGGAGVPGPPFVRRKLEQQARRYAPGRLEGCLGAIHDADEALKGQGVLPPELALERLILGLSA
jgi:DNA polymerase-3 subunit delta